MTLYVSSVLIACGICFFAGIHAILARVPGEREPVNLAFGCMSLLLACYLALDAAIYQTEALSLARSLARSKLTVACAIYPAAVWFMGLYSNLRRWRLWLGLAVVVFGGFLVANLFSANGMIYDTIVKGPPIVLPWGERLPDYIGTRSQLFGAYFLARDAAYFWAIGCCVVLWRRRNRERAWPLTLYLLAQGGAALHVDIVNRAGTPTVTYEALAFLLLVLLMGNRLRRDLQNRNQALADNLAELRAETLRRENVEADLRHLAYHDRLTGLPNRLQLYTHLQEALAGDNPGDSALIMFDLDRFRTINQALGHDAGDALLKAVAGRLAVAAPPGSLVARHGGDEFALHVELPAGTPPAQSADRIARDISTRLVAPFGIGAHDLAVGVSVGIALLPGVDRNVDSTLRQVNVALHRAKAGGRHATVVFESTMQAEADRRLLLEKGLRLALERDEFELHYQPQLNRHGRFIGAEALLRWRHPEHGMIAPGEFIPIVEETGLIHTIGNEVLRRACMERERWPAKYADARISINVSPWQLISSDFVHTVRGVVDAARVDPRRVVLEITENALLHDTKDVARKMRELTELGFWFSLDDFGSGYASLGNMKKLPLHELKIDRGFVEGLQPGTRDPFTESIIAIAHDQKLHVVAEGVETAAQREALEALDCDAFQGYLFSRPLPATEFHRWLEQHMAQGAMPDA
jgi:diguanylate cyclase (GGDEF)-like protein